MSHIYRQEPEQKARDPTCPQHPNKKVQVLCDNCNKLVCLSCITDPHICKGHSLSQFEEKIEKNINDLKEYVQDASTLHIPNCMQFIDKIRKRKEKIDENKTLSSQEISQAFDIFKKQLQKTKTMVEEEMNSIYKEQCEKLDRLEEKLLTTKGNIETKSKDFAHVLGTGTLVEIYNAKQSLQKNNEEANIPELPNIETLEFDKTVVTNAIQTLLNMFKVFPAKPLKHSNGIISTKIIQSKCYYITPVSENKAWCVIFKNDQPKLCLINEHGEVEKEIQTSANVINLFLHPISKILYGSFDDNTIRTIDTNSDATTTVLKCPNKPDSFTVTSNGDIIEGECTLGYVYRFSNSRLLHQSKEKYQVYDISYNDNDYVAIATGNKGIHILDGTLTEEIATHQSSSYSAVYDKDGGLIIGDCQKKNINILYEQNLKKIRTLTPDKMTEPRKIRLYNNSMWVDCGDFILNVMFQ